MTKTKLTCDDIFGEKKSLIQTLASETDFEILNLEIISSTCLISPPYKNKAQRGASYTMVFSSCYFNDFMMLREIYDFGFGVEVD